MSHRLAKVEILTCCTSPGAAPVSASCLAPRNADGGTWFAAQASANYPGHGRNNWERLFSMYLGIYPTATLPSQR